jgi:hypothetical protein
MKVLFPKVCILLASVICTGQTIVGTIPVLSVAEM